MDKPSLEFDIQNTQWIVEKIRQSSIYAQNLYAALCNNEFIGIYSNTPEDIIRILESNSNVWSCSWRYAGGIIADIRGQGDYLDWYCSGIRSDYIDDNGESYVGEGVVTEEIKYDLSLLGWSIKNNK